MTERLKWLGFGSMFRGMMMLVTLGAILGVIASVVFYFSRKRLRGSFRPPFVLLPKCNKV